ncbi:MAG: type II toxin-antitoxin system RelE/ParE family toxin [Thermomicrobiales bacterium]
MSPLEFEFQLEFYEEDNGDVPVKTFLADEARSNPQLAARTLAAINKLKDRRYHRSPNTEDLGDGMYELRVLGKDGARLLFFHDNGRRIVLCHAFKKTTRKTPPREKRVAQERRQRYGQRQRQ